MSLSKVLELCKGLNELKDGKHYIPYKIGLVYIVYCIG